MFTQPLPERWVRFEGLNTADSNREVVIDLSRVAINPAKELSVILDDALPNSITLFDLAVDPPALWGEQRERVGR